MYTHNVSSQMLGKTQMPVSDIISDEIKPLSVVDCNDIVTCTGNTLFFHVWTTIILTVFNLGNMDLPPGVKNRYDMNGKQNGKEKKGMNNRDKDRGQNGMRIKWWNK